jgi:hypothetical protein
MWGVHDMVAPVRVADYVFTTALQRRAVPGAYWLLPCGNHYVQHDQPADLLRSGARGARTAVRRALVHLIRGFSQMPRTHSFEHAGA